MHGRQCFRFPLLSSPVSLLAGDQGRHMHYRGGVGAGLWLSAMLWHGVAFAQERKPEAGAPTQLTADAGLDRVRSARLEAYRSVLADFDAATHSAPDDVALAFSR